MPNNCPSVDIVVCNYQNKEITIKCLDALLDLIYTDYNIILVDDCSPDDEAEFFRQRYPDITVIKNTRNLGPAKTRNIGISHGCAKYVVTMDNDAKLSALWLKQMVELMEEDEKIGQAVGKILFFDHPEKIAAAGGTMLLRGRGFDIGLGEPADSPKYNKTRQVLYACSASMIVRRDILNEVGGFCDLYYHGYEDTDLSLRINTAGYRVVYYPEAVSFHSISATVNRTIGQRRTYLWMRNRLLIMMRNYQLPNLVKYIPANLRFNLRNCLNQPENFMPFLKSILWIIVNFTSIIRQRKIINGHRKVDDKQLEKLFDLN